MLFFLLSWPTSLPFPEMRTVPRARTDPIRHRFRASRPRQPSKSGSSSSFDSGTLNPVRPLLARSHVLFVTCGRRWRIPR